MESLRKPVVYPLKIVSTVTVLASSQMKEPYLLVSRGVVEREEI